MTKLQQKKKKQTALRPISVTRDVWFYQTPKELQFTVYIGEAVTLFNLPISKIKVSPIRKNALLKRISYLEETTKMWNEKYVSLLKEIKDNKLK